MPYTGTTPFAVAVQALADRLYDHGLVQWSSLELQGYLVEALRTWQALTGSTKDSGVFQAAPGTVFYDLPTVLPTLRGYTVSSVDLVRGVQYALLEPPTPITWTGTEQFTLQDVNSAIQERRNRWLETTQAVLVSSELAPLPSPSSPGRVALPDATVAVQRLAWQDPQGRVWPLQRDSEWGLSAYSRGWVQTPGTPRAFSTSVTLPLELQLSPAPLNAGVLQGLFVTMGPPIPSTGALLDIPDDWTWVVRFGALAELLSRDGLALDPLRAQYCEARWRHGIQMAKQAQVALAARVENVPCQIDTIAQADAYQPTWQNTLGAPKRLLSAGHTTLALAPPPGPQPGPPSWSVTLDLVPNMPIPTYPSGILQVDQGLLPLIYDYAEHLASFKLGPGQLQAAQPLLDRFLTAAGTSLTMRQIWGAQKSRPVESLPEDRYMPGTAAPVGVH